MADSTSKLFVDLLAGTVGGITQLCVGHPFDTIKVKLQGQEHGQKQFSGPYDAVKKTVSQEGIRGIYKGMGAPLATVAAFNAVLFSARGTMERLLAHEDARILKYGIVRFNSVLGSPLGIWDQAIAGSGAGIAVSFLATPTELLKCRLQVQGEIHTATARLRAKGIDPATVKLYRGPLDVAKHVFSTEGGIAGLYRGLTITLIREIPGNALMFGFYEATKVFFARKQGLTSTSELSTTALLIAGGVGGSAFWIPMYPSDFIKSRIQVDNVHKPLYNGIWDTARKIYRADGIRGYYPGFMPCVLRSFPANAACFLAYELCLNTLS